MSDKKDEESFDFAFDDDSDLSLSSESESINPFEDSDPFADSSKESAFTDEEFANPFGEPSSSEESLGNDGFVSPFDEDDDEPESLDKDSSYGSIRHEDSNIAEPEEEEVKDFSQKRKFEIPEFLKSKKIIVAIIGILVVILGFGSMKSCSSDEDPVQTNDQQTSVEDSGSTPNGDGSQYPKYRPIPPEDAPVLGGERR